MEVKVSKLRVVKVTFDLCRSTLTDQFNDYVDQTLGNINSKQVNSSALPNHFVQGTSVYLLIEVEYALWLYNGSVEGLQSLQRSGDASIQYHNSAGNLTISVPVLLQQLQVTYNAEVNVYGFTHSAALTCYIPPLNVSVGLSVNTANLHVTLDMLTVNITQEPILSVQSSDPVVDYFAPSFLRQPALSSQAVETVARWSIQSTVDILNDRNFGYY